MSDVQGYLEILTSDQVRQIHLTALRVLEDVGLWLPNREILELLLDAGAKVNFDTKTALIPTHIVEASIKSFPPRFTWYSRVPKHCLEMNGIDTYFAMPDTAINIIDLEGRRRPGTAADGENICLLCDALPNMAIAATGVDPPGMPAGVLEAWHTKTVFTNSSKAVILGCGSRCPTRPCPSWSRSSPLQRNLQGSNRATRGTQSSKVCYKASIQMEIG